MNDTRSNFKTCDIPQGHSSWPLWIWRFLSISLRPAVSVLYNALWYSVFNVRIYTTDDAIDQVTANLTSCWRFGNELVHGRMIPLYAIGLNPFVIVVTQITMTMTGERRPVMTVIRAYNSGPIIPDVSSADKNMCPKDSISIIEYDMGAKILCFERAVSHLVPESVVANATHVAISIRDEYMAANCDNMVYILHGHPGCGKSITLRVLAQYLSDSDLYADYDPTCNFSPLFEILMHNTPTIVGYEEFDVSFKKIVCDAVRSERSSKHFAKVDAVDKASWNRMIDKFKRRTKSILVMTTNLGVDDMLPLCNGDPSLLRHGRVDAHFVWTAEGRPKRLPPMFTPCAPCG